MKNKFFGEIIISVVLILLLVLSLNPFHFFMPSVLQMTLLCILVLVFGVFTVFVWKEKVQDERESMHRLFAGRVAFLSGTIILVIGIVAEHLQLQKNPWLEVALVGMVLSKLIGLVYSRLKF
jgi:predicted ABC-type exoprotein transport system permease subunit